MGIAAILFNGVELFEQIVNILSTDDPMWNLVKIAHEILDKKALKITMYTISYMYI